jgi:hypothetical protein
MRRLYEQISDRLSLIDFNALWPGFHRYGFALYTSSEVCLSGKIIKWDERFIGNTAIRYENEYIAIWNIEEEPVVEAEDLNKLASNIVHEMFHAYQYDCGESRFPQDLITLTYPLDVKNFSMKYEENRLLADAFEAEDPEERNRLFNLFCNIRLNRQALIGAMIDCEYLTETAEGMAEYTGLKALRALSPQAYAEKTRVHADILRRCEKTQLNIRRISYFSGALLLLTADALNIDFTHSISDEKQPVFKIISVKMSPEPVPDIMDNAVVGDIISQETGGAASEIASFISRAKSVKTGRF